MQHAFFHFQATVMHITKSLLEMDDTKEDDLPNHCFAAQNFVHNWKEYKSMCVVIWL